jgi:succinate-semialdehyde dehydrogenase/glutarate-semialdehyde dehydrogenase
MVIRTVNPYSGETLQEYPEESLEHVKSKISDLKNAQRSWRLSLDRRIEALKEIRNRFDSNSTRLAKLMSEEMGKPISQSESEVKKCIWLMDVVVEKAAEFLQPESVRTEARKSYVRFDPLGTLLFIMPWNFPAWQVMRAAVPALAAGNAVLLKHASMVTGTSLMLQELIGLDVFKSVVTRGEVAASAIAYVDGVSLTGSTTTGSSVAAEAGRHIKKVVLELGGSDPFIVLEDADMTQTLKGATFGRLQNNGQSCIASKRFIVHDSVYDDFYRGLKEEFSKVEIGDPLVGSTFLGPLSSGVQKETVSSQINVLKSLGKVETLSEVNHGNFVPPTIVRTDAKFDEEVFGPVAIVKRFHSKQEAVELANETPFGLGASIWGNEEKAEALATMIEAGMVFINKVVASDPRLPFGGVKKSGIGRELARYGMLEFTNVKTVWVN